MIELPDGRFVAVVRMYDASVRTSLCWLDPEQGTMTESLRLPSGGDTSCAGLVWYEELLWISYYSSHEGKTSIYLAKVKIPVQGANVKTRASLWPSAKFMGSLPAALLLSRLFLSPRHLQCLQVRARAQSLVHHGA